MTMGKILSQFGMGVTQVSDRYADNHRTSPHEHITHYAYESDTPPSYGHSASSKHHHGGNKSNAALSALTLLAFLFFLNILQQCLKEHMNTMNTPQVMVMTAGREDEILAKISNNNELDKSEFVKSNLALRKGIVPEMREDNMNKHEVNVNRKPIKNYESVKDKILTKIKTAHHVPKRGHFNHSLTFPGYVSAMHDRNEGRKLGKPTMS